MCVLGGLIGVLGGLVGAFFNAANIALYCQRMHCIHNFVCTSDFFVCLKLCIVSLTLVTQVFFLGMATALLSLVVPFAFGQCV